MDLTALIARCKARFRDPDNDIVSDTEWTAYLNEAYQAVLAVCPWLPSLEGTWTVTVPAGTSSVAVDSDVWRVERVSDADGVVLEAINDPTRERALADGTPQVYRMYANMLEVYPAPDVNVTYTVDGWQAPPVLAIGTDVPLLPVAYHRLLVSGALEAAYLDDGNGDQAAAHGNAFAAGVSRMVAEMTVDRQGPEQIDDTFFV